MLISPLKEIFGTVEIRVSDKNCPHFGDIRIFFSEARRVKSSNLAGQTTAGHQSSVPDQRMKPRSEQRGHLFGSMLSLEEIKAWADMIEAQSTSKLIKISHNPARPARGVLRKRRLSRLQQCRDFAPEPLVPGVVLAARVPIQCNVGCRER
jgi:hypothetical protein